MAQILSFDAHRRDRERQRAGPTGLPLHRPCCSDRELWTRDYREPENIIYAVLKIKEILDYHLYADDVWPYLLLSFMEAVSKLNQGEDVDLPGTGASLKGLRAFGRLPGEQTRYVHGLAPDRTHGEIPELSRNLENHVAASFLVDRQR